MSATKMIGVAESFFAGVDYEPLVATWPERSIDAELLANAPPEARYILKKAYAAYKSGYSEDAELWAEWLALFEYFGPQHEGVQVGLLGLLFLRHEARHHLDFYATPLGWFFPSVLAGLYLRLQQFVEALAGTQEEREMIRRLDRSFRVQNLVLGNIPSFEEKTWEQVPLIERQTKIGIVRYRVLRGDPGLALATVKPMAGTERAISVNSMLETRAVIETSGMMAGRLRAAGASDGQVASAIRLLLSLTVQVARDDYWALLNIGLPAIDLDEAAKVLAARGLPCLRLFVATWFGLHIELPSKETQGPDLPGLPALRFLFALHELSKFSDHELSRRTINWEDVFEQLSKCIGGEQLVVVAASHRHNLDALERSLGSGGWFTGLAQQHLSYLAKVAREGMALRGQPLHWCDNVGRPEQEDPTTVVNWAEASEAITTTWSRLARVRNQLRGNQYLAAKDIARSLF